MSESKLTTLLLATGKGDLDGVIKCLHFLTPEAMHELVDSAEEMNGDTCLLIAAREGHMEIIQYLIESDCNLDITNTNGETAVVAATVSGHNEIANVLATAWCDLVGETDPGTPQLIFYCLYNNPTIITMLLDQYRCDVNATSTEGFTALMAAATTDSVELMTILLDHGADMNMENVDGDNALLLSLAHDAMAATTLLLERKCKCNHKSHDGDTPLMMCVVKGYIEFTKSMLTKSTSNDNDTVDEDVDLDAVNVDNLTALHMATMINNIDFVRLLLEHGANPLLESVSGETALDIAIAKQYIDIAAILETAVVTIIGGPDAVSSNVTNMLSDDVPVSVSGGGMKSGKSDDTVSVGSSKGKKKKKNKNKSNIPDSNTTTNVTGVAKDTGNGNNIAMNNSLQLNEDAIDAKIELALSTLHDTFDKSLNDTAELLAVHMDEKMDKNLMDIREFIQTSMDSMTSVISEQISSNINTNIDGANTTNQATTGTPLVSDNEQLTRRASGRKAPLNTNRDIDRTDRTDKTDRIQTQALDSIRETLVSVALAVGDSKHSTADLFEQFLSKMNKNNTEVERRMQDSIQQLKKSIQRMVNEVTESHTTGMLSHSAEVALSASAAIDEKYVDGSGSGTDGVTANPNTSNISSNNNASNNEVVKLLQQMRSDQLKAQRQVGLDREDEMSNLRRQLHEYSAKLIHVEEELFNLKKNGVGVVQMGQGQGGRLVKNGNSSNGGRNAHSVDIMAYEGEEVHDFGSPSHSSKNMGNMGMGRSVGFEGTGSGSGRKPINPKIMGIHKQPMSQSKRKGSGLGGTNSNGNNSNNSNPTRPLSPNTMDALAYLKEETHNSGKGRGSNGPGSGSQPNSNSNSNGYMQVQESGLNQNQNGNSTNMSTNGDVYSDINKDIAAMLQKHGSMGMHTTGSGSSGLNEASQLLSTPYIALNNSTKNTFGTSASRNAISTGNTTRNGHNTNTNRNIGSPNGTNTNTGTRRGRSTSPRGSRGTSTGSGSRFMENTDSSLTKTSLNIESLSRSKSPSKYEPNSGNMNMNDEASRKPPMRFNQKKNTFV